MLNKISVNDLKFKPFKSNKCLVIFLIKLFLKTKVGPIISLVLPLCFMIIYYIIANFNNDVETFVENLSLYISLSIIPFTMIIIPQIIVELKNSILLRKTKTSGFSKLNVITLMFLVYSVISLLITLFNFLIYIIFLATKSGGISYLANLNFGLIFFATILLIFIAVSFAIVIGNLTKTTLSSQILGVILFLVSMSLAGMFIPLELLSNIFALKILTLFSPLNYPINLLINTIKKADEGTLSAIEKIITSGDPIKIQSLKTVLTRLGLEMNDNLIQTIKNGNDIFKPNYSYYFFFQLGEIANILNFEPIDGTKIYDVWQKYTNLLMPFVLITSFSLLSFFTFSWYKR